MLTVLIRPRARKDLRSLPPADAGLMFARIKEFSETRTGNIRPVQGTSGDYGLRSGKWRAIYSIDGNVMTIKRIRDRKEAYR